MSIEFVCQCGAKLRAKDALAGKRLKCPKCSAVLTIPQPDPPESEMDGLDLDALADFDSPAPSTRKGGRAAGASRRSSGDNQMVIIAGIAAGVVALLVIVVILLLTRGSHDDSDQIAAREQTERTETDREPDDAADDDAADDDPADDVAGDVADDVTDDETADDNPFDQETPDEADGSQATTTTESPASDQSEMQVALQKWHAQSNTLVGTRRVDIEDDDSTLMTNYGWMCELLPFLGYQELYDKFTFSKKWTEAENLVIAAVVIPEFLNPEDSRYRWEGYPFQGLALTHFVGMSGIEDQRNVVAASLPRSDPRAGIFGYDEVLKEKDVTDGTGKTIMLIGAGRIVAPWVQGGGSTIRGAREPYFNELTGFGLPSNEGKSTVAAFADGSARRISSEIDPRVFRALCTAHGGETVDVTVAGPELGPFPTHKRADFNDLQKASTSKNGDP